jgi:solute carrier family 10 (sodium/bile acid cotransporter), member 3/5
VGCSPGGGASNIWTMLLGGDLNLSMVMTFFSSTAALGMMPLWLFLLKNFFLGANVRVPFEHITGDLLLIVIPVCSGMLLRWKKERYALQVCRITTPLSHVFVIYILTFSTYVNWYIFRMFYRQPYLMAIGASLPWAGFFAGALSAFLLRQTRAQIIAIALETGIQNVGIAIVVLMYSFEQPEGSIGAAMPIATSLFTPVPLYILLATMKIRRRCNNENSDQKVPIAIEDTPPEMSEGNDEKESDEDVEKQTLSSSYRDSTKEVSIPMEGKEKQRFLVT